MGDATGGALAVPARALPAVPMATPVGIARCRREPIVSSSTRKMYPAFPFRVQANCDNAASAGDIDASRPC